MFVRLGEHYASVEAAIGALGELPEWKTKGIIAEAKNRLCVLAIQSLQESMNLAVEATTAASADEPKKGGKKKDDDRVDVAEPVLAAIKHARSLKSDVVSPKVATHDIPKTRKKKKYQSAHINSNPSNLTLNLSRLDCGSNERMHTCWKARSGNWKPVSGPKTRTKQRR